jgi:hypothetical protein
MVSEKEREQAIDSDDTQTWEHGNWQAGSQTDVSPMSTELIL